MSDFLDAAERSIANVQRGRAGRSLRKAVERLGIERVERNERGGLVLHCNTEKGGRVRMENVDTETMDPRLELLVRLAVEPRRIRADDLLRCRICHAHDATQEGLERAHAPECPVPGAIEALEAIGAA